MQLLAPLLIHLPPYVQSGASTQGTTVVGASVVVVDDVVDDDVELVAVLHVFLHAAEAVAPLVPTFLHRLSGFRATQSHPPLPPSQSCGPGC